LALGVAGCGGRDGDTPRPSATKPPAQAEIGPMAPDAAGKPVTFTLDGVEIGMTFDEVRGVWGKPAAGASQFALTYARKGGYAKVHLYGAGSPAVVMGIECQVAEESAPTKDEALATLTKDLGPPVTDPRELALKVSQPEWTTLFRPARYAYAVAHWGTDLEDEQVVRFRTLETSLHPSFLLRVPRSEWESLRYPIPWGPPETAKPKLEVLEVGRSPSAGVETLLGPPVRITRNEALGYDTWHYWYWKEGPYLEFSVKDGVLYGSSRSW
jgi:hypothetical protein